MASKRPEFYDTPLSPFYLAARSSPPRWYSRIPHQSRFSRVRFTPLRLLVIFTTLCSVVFLERRFSPGSYSSIYPKSYLNKTYLPRAPFQPPEVGPYRASDTIDTFASYKYHDACNISSLDLHAAFSPLCESRESMLRAMSGGGRIGFDSPYMPLGCDMRWFSSEETCEILERFERVLIVGDSMLRHVTGSMNIFVRRNIGYGAVTDWNFSPQERRECFCNEQFNVKACSVQGIYKTADVLLHDQTSVSCRNNINIAMEEIVKFPIPLDELARLRASLLDLGSKNKRRKIAIIFGHGLWSDLDLRRTLDWLDSVLNVIHSVLSPPEWHGLFVTPNAAGRLKPDEWLITQGNKALMKFEESIGLEVAKRGIEHLGTWNMSIQSTKYDGVHLDLRGNLVKGMMVMNWLNMI